MKPKLKPFDPGPGTVRCITCNHSSKVVVKIYLKGKQTPSKLIAYCELCDKVFTIQEEPEA